MILAAVPQGPGPARVAGRHYLTKAEINALYFATHSMKRPRGWDDPSPVGRYWRAALVMFFNYGIDTGTVCKSCAMPRADPLATRLLGPALARPRSQGAVAVWMAVLSPGEDEQGVPPADEPHRPCAHQEHYAREPAAFGSRYSLVVFTSGENGKIPFA